MSRAVSPAASPGPYTYNAGTPWYYQLAAWAGDSVSSDFVDSYIDVDPRNTNPNILNTNTAITHWVGANANNGPNGGFVQVGYEVDPRNTLRFFAFTYIYVAPNNGTGKIDSTQFDCIPPAVSFQYDIGTGCYVDPSQLAIPLGYGNYYDFAMRQTAAGVTAEVCYAGCGTGFNIMFVSLAGAACQPNCQLITPYMTTEVSSADGNVSLQDELNAGMKLAGEFAELFWEDPTGVDTDATSLYQNGSGITDVNGNKTYGNQGASPGESGYPGACVPNTQYAGWYGTPDSYTAGNFQGSCLPGIYFPLQSPAPL